MVMQAFAHYAGDEKDKVKSKFNRVTNVSVMKRILKLMRHLWRYTKMELVKYD